MIRSSSRHSRAGVIPAQASFPRRRHSRAGVIPAQASFPRRRHSRAGGNPARPKLDSRLRGNDDPIAALDAESAEALINIKALL
jgi:hypothetical protein